jgi:hypothetical protein
MKDEQPPAFAGLLVCSFAIASRVARPDNQGGEGSSLRPEMGSRMTRLCGFVAALLTLASSSEAVAQLLVSPPVLVPAPVVLIPNAIGITYQRRHLPLAGFYNTGYAVGAAVPSGAVYGYPYGSLDGRITVKIISPTVVLAPRPLFPVQDVDLRGVDLDVVGPEVLQPGGKPNLIQIPVPPADKRPRERMELPKKVEPPARPPAVPEPPKKEVAPKPAPPPAPAKPAPPDLPGAKEGPLEESRRLTELGLSAFHDRQYGLAALRFGQAAEAEPAQPIPYFLLAQANVALGKYKQAVAAIENGMRRQDDWPLSAFQPRDLYKGIDDDWFFHKKQLADVQALHPNQSVYLFLQAYQWWFDGQRDQAIPMLERARVLAPENPFIAEFLKVVPKLAAG